MELAHDREKFFPRQSGLRGCKAVAADQNSDPFFGGLSIEETAEVLNVSPATVKREWVMARAWLNRELAIRRA